MHHPFGIKFGWGTYEVRQILTVVCFFSVIKLEEGRTTWQRTVRRNNNGHPILCSSTKIEEDMPGYGDTHHCFQKYKKRYSVVTLFWQWYKVNNDISIVNELRKSTPTNRSIIIILMGTKPGYPRKKAFLHFTSDSTTTIWTMTAQPPCTFCRNNMYTSTEA